MRSNGLEMKTGKQEVLTPPEILDRLCAEWGSIILDPCSEPACSNVPASIHYVEKGLEEPWFDRTYINPPFRYGKRWLIRAMQEDGKRIALLSMNRTHRTWFRDAQDRCNAWIELNPIAFVGFDNVLPSPLVLLCFGWLPSAKIWAPHKIRSYN